jgi:nucleoside phosphorylase
MRTRWSPRLPAAVLGAALLAWAGLWARAAEAADARGGLCAALTARKGSSARLAVVSAFPGELAPLVAQARKPKRVEVGGRPFYVGTLAGVRVVLGMTRIGMVNAAETAEILLANFDIAGFVFSGVAGFSQPDPDSVEPGERIGDVLVAAEWLERATGLIFPANPFLLELAGRATCGLELERCVLVTFTPPVETVCFPRDPVVVVGGRGVSGDPFGGQASPCNPNPPERLGDVLGCDITAPADRPAPRRGRPSHAVSCVQPLEPPMAEDMETAAVARVAAAHGVPFVALRGVSDGAGDPRGPRFWVSQFFDYYQLAADNAADGTVAVLSQLRRLGSRGAQSSICRLLARERWEQAVGVLRSRSGRR